MATVRVSQVTAQSNAPSSVRLAGVAVIDGTPAPDARFRLAAVHVDNAPQGDCWVMSAGVWRSASMFVRVAGSWV